jgi:predicted amidohydrolase YtcJ
VSELAALAVRVLSQNIFEVAPREIGAISVRMTIVDGEVIRGDE